MLKCRYIGPGPEVDPGTGALIHPGDVWEFPGEPSFGLWELAGAQDAEKPSEAAQAPAPTQSPAGGPETAAPAESAPSSTEEA